MKTTITAKQDFVIKQGTAQVRILKGDSYEVYGNVFAVGNVLVDLRHYYGMFDAVNSVEMPQPLYLEAIHNLRITSRLTDKSITITSGQVIKLWSNVISINGVTFDICDYCYDFKRYYRVTSPAVTNLAFNAETKQVTWTGTTGSYRVTVTKDEGEPEEIAASEATFDMTSAEPGAYVVSVVQLNKLGDASEAAEIEFTVEAVAEPDANQLNAPVQAPVQEPTQEPETQEPAAQEPTTEPEGTQEPETQEPEANPNEVQIPEL